MPASAAEAAPEQASIDLPDEAERFSGRGPWKERLPQILQTLEALGRARREGERWRG